MITADSVVRLSTSNYSDLETPFYRMVPFSVTLTDPNPVAKITAV